MHSALVVQTTAVRSAPGTLDTATGVPPVVVRGSNVVSRPDPSTAVHCVADGHTSAVAALGAVSIVVVIAAAGLLGSNVHSRVAPIAVH